jgi:NAD(P)-dependent dehydrogenase (short-subunit alcohol dehydrogenase family)
MSSLSSTWLLVGVAGFAGVVGISLWRYIFVIGTPCRSKRQLKGKTVIITGANTGIGKETAIDIAKRGARVIIGCRDEARGMAALEDIKRSSESQNVSFKQLDLASLASIRKFSEEILEEEREINVLINNAGVMFTSKLQTEDGFELQFGVNHLGHFLLTNLLLDRIKESSPSRIVNVSSIGHYFAGPLDFNDMMWSKGYSPWKAYCRSKLANVMFTRELARRLEGTGVSAYSLHPGSIKTELQRHMFEGWRIIFKPLLWVMIVVFWKTPLQGAQTSIHCAVSETCEGVTGKYWTDCVVKKPNKLALVDEDCERLWEYSADKVGLKE